MYQSCIFALAIDNADNLYAGGEFLSAGGKFSPNVAMCRLNGSAVQPRRTVNSSLHPLAYDSRSSIIRLNVQSATNVSYRIFSLAGREVHRDAAFLPKGNNSLRINTASLANGPYIAQVNAGKESMRFRMTVKR